MSRLEASACRRLRHLSRVATPFEVARRYGVLSSIEKDNLYWFGWRGFLYTSPWVITPDTVRHPAVLLLTASGEPVELEIGGHISRYAASAIAPRTRRGLRAVDVGVISVHIDIQHPWFSAFRRIPQPGVLGLDRKAFEDFNLDLLRAYHGRLNIGEANQLFEVLVETAAMQLPSTGRHNERSDLLHAFLIENPTCSLSDVARELNVSYKNATPHFSRAIGVPFSAYQHSLKCIRASRLFFEYARLTEVAHKAGFTDSAHFTRTWQRHYGHPPSYTRDDRYVRIIA